MTSTSPPALLPLPLARRELLATAREDIHAAMAGAIPFVLAHPDEAAVLSELGAIAAASPAADRDLDVFRTVVGELVANAARGEGDGGDFDVVVVGGGAAGLSAALVLGRARRRVVVVDAGSPRNAPASRMQGFLSRDGMAPADLVASGRAEVARYGVVVRSGRVDSITPGFVVRLAGGEVVTARRVVIATGVADELPDIPGVRERWGRDLLHCPYCHGWEVRDQALGVLGTHPGAVEHALLVRQWSEDVVYFAHANEPTAVEARQLAARGIGVVRGEVSRLVVDDDRLTGVGLTDGRVVARSAVFIRPSNPPRADGLLAGLGAETDARGFAVVDATGRTSAAGVWAVGNAVDPRAQVITAAGAGSAAAIAVNGDLVAEDVARSEARAAA